MRIIGGSHKGKKITAPQNLPVRPTTDFAKEGLFNILNNHFDFNQTKVLDLCCGTGNITFEFLSRGCLSIVSVDQNFNCYNFVKHKCKELFEGDRFLIIKSDIFRFLNKDEMKYDIIFCDPPYDLPNYLEIITIIFERKLLKETGWLIVEHDKNNTFETHSGFKECRKYGNVNFSIFSY